MVSEGPERLDAVVVGGGFYGACIASYLVRRRGLVAVALLEREPALLQRASYGNQARVHNGYHYPRSFVTAFRSRVNFPRFIADWPEAVVRDFTKVYAIARQGSKVSPAQFEKFIRDVGAPMRPVSDDVAALFDERTVAGAYEVDEWAFDSRALKRWAEHELAGCGVDVRLDTTATSVRKGAGDLVVRYRTGAATEEDVRARWVFNCTYSGIGQVAGDLDPLRAEVHHELAEMALVEVPHPLRGLGVTVMDGPFFSVMPFPARSSHSLSHVRYTPRHRWVDAPGDDPYLRLHAEPQPSRVLRTIRDAQRFIPMLGQVSSLGTIREVKTVLRANDSNDGRPILVQRHVGAPGAFSILGGKIDNIYDVLEQLDQESLR